jgi:hypothetical protein
MPSRHAPSSLWKTPQGYAAEFCTRCKAGWTRTGETGSVTVCLLDREPVLTGMTNCDRFDMREPERR